VGWVRVDGRGSLRRPDLFVCTIHGDLSSGNIKCNDF